MASIDPRTIDLDKYEKFSSEKSKNEAWNYTTRYRLREDIRKHIPKDIRKNREGLKYDELWKCNYCGEFRAGNVGRAVAHLACVKDQGSNPCREVDPNVREKFALALKRKDVDVDVDVDTRENKRRNPSKSSGLEGNSSHSTIPRVTNGSVEVSPGSAQMSGWSYANPQEHLHDTVRQITTFGLGNSQLNAVGGGGNISNIARLDQPSGEISMVDGPMGLRFCRLPIFEELENLESRATGGQGADTDSTIGLGSTPLNPSGGAGRNHSNFTGQQPSPNIVNMETTIVEMPPQRSNLGETWGSGFSGPEDVEAGDFDMACLEDVGAEGSDFTSPRVQGSTGLLSDVVGHTRTSRLGNSQLNAVEEGGNISNLTRPEQPFGIVSMANAPMSMLSQPSTLGEMAGSSAACAQGADAGELFPLGSAIRSGNSPLHPNGEAGINNSSSLAYQPLPPSAVSMEMPSMGASSQWSNLREIQGSGMARPEDAGAGCSNSTSPGFGNLGMSSKRPHLRETERHLRETERLLREAARTTESTKKLMGPRGEAARTTESTKKLMGPRENSPRSPLELASSVSELIRLSRKLLERWTVVNRQKIYLEKIGDYTTVIMKGMDGWLKTAEAVRQQVDDCLMNIGFTPEQVRHLSKIDISAEQVRQLTDDLLANRTTSEIDQLMKNMKQLGKQIKKLKEESEDFFSEIPLDMVLIEFMNCRWVTSSKESYLFNTSITGVYISQDGRKEDNRNIEGICRSTEPWGKWESISEEMVIVASKFIERAHKFFIRVSYVGTQKTYLMEIGEFATRRIKEIDGWLKSAEPVKRQAVHLLENIGFTPEQMSQLSKIDISVEQVRWLSNDLLEKRPVKEIFQLVKNMEELGKQFRKLKKESEDFFNQISLKTVLVKFMNCRWDSSLKDHPKETLSMPLPC